MQRKYMLCIIVYRCENLPCLTKRPDFCCSVHNGVRAKEKNKHRSLLRSGRRKQTQTSLFVVGNPSTLVAFTSNIWISSKENSWRVSKIRGCLETCHSSPFVIILIFFKPETWEILCCRGWTWLPSIDVDPTDCFWFSGRTPTDPQLRIGNIRNCALLIPIALFTHYCTLGGMTTWPHCSPIGS